MKRLYRLSEFLVFAAGDRDRIAPRPFAHIELCTTRAEAERLALSLTDLLHVVQVAEVHPE